MDWLGLSRHAEETDVLGDIDHWITAYLDSGRHLQDWNQRMQAQQAQFAAFLQAPLGFQPFPATPPAMEEETPRP